MEDEDPVRAVNARALSARGYTVLEAASGVEALQIIEERGAPVDLVVSDVVMPEMDGPTLLGELRKRYPDLKVIFVSGYAEDAFKKNLPEGEEFNFLPKPFSLRQLVETVKQVTGQRETAAAWSRHRIRGDQRSPRGSSRRYPERRSNLQRTPEPEGADSFELVTSRSSPPAISRTVVTVLRWPGMRACVEPPGRGRIGWSSASCCMASSTAAPVSGGRRGQPGPRGGGGRGEDVPRAAPSRGTRPPQATRWLSPVPSGVRASSGLWAVPNRPRARA